MSSSTTIGSNEQQPKDAAAAEATSSPLVRLTILIKKLDTLSDEEFHKYWSESHPKIWLNVKIVKEKVVRYSQFHVNRAVTDALAANGLPVSDYDGGVEIWTRSVEDLMAIFQDEEYNRLVVPDEESFLKRHDAKLMIGHQEDKWIDGKVL